MHCSHALSQVDVRLGDAVTAFRKWSTAKEDGIELLFLDGIPKDTLSYLQVNCTQESPCSYSCAEPCTYAQRPKPACAPRSGGFE